MGWLLAAIVPTRPSRRWVLPKICLNGPLTAPLFDARRWSSGPHLGSNVPTAGVRGSAAAPHI
jgi:hypothetical protein